MEKKRRGRHQQWLKNGNDNGWQHTNSEYEEKKSTTNDRHWMTGRVVAGAERKITRIDRSRVRVCLYLGFMKLSYSDKVGLVSQVYFFVIPFIMDVRLHLLVSYICGRTSRGHTGGTQLFIYLFISTFLLRRLP